MQEVRLVRILVASPSDVQHIREAISEIIERWNVANTKTTGIHLTTVRWETHVHPEIGERPQQIINSQIVDSADLAIGVFWTRLGTPTGVAESGAVEELIRLDDAGKPVAIYFSKELIAPDNLDQEQYSRLKKFKADIQKRAIYSEFKSEPEFREMFATQLSSIVNRCFLRPTSNTKPPVDSPQTLDYFAGELIAMRAEWNAEYSVGSSRRILMRLQVVIQRLLREDATLKSDQHQRALSGVLRDLKLFTEEARLNAADGITPKYSERGISLIDETARIAHDLKSVGSSS